MVYYQRSVIYIYHYTKKIKNILLSWSIVYKLEVNVIRQTNFFPIYTFPTQIKFLHFSPCGSVREKTCEKFVGISGSTGSLTRSAATIKFYQQSKMSQLFHFINRKQFEKPQDLSLKEELILIKKRIRDGYSTFVNNKGTWYFSLFC